LPIYEFYCKGCNTVYKFLSRKVNTDTIPDCPTCKDVKLNRKVSLFAPLSDRKEDSDGMPPVDEGKMEKAMSMLVKEAGTMNEDDPRHAAQLMRKLTDATGLKMSGGMEEALSRMEKGEDPEKIEREMGDILESEDPFTAGGKGKRTQKHPGPYIDETLYEL
jgi:putative FmdB family regulatory protein